MAADGEAEDRTEEPTQRRLDQAVERGDVARSPELATFASLAALALGLAVAAAGTGRTLVAGLTGYLGNAHLVPATGGAMIGAGQHALLVWAKAVAAPVGLVCLVAVAASAIGHRPLWTVEPLLPKPSRLSPMTGLKRILGREAATNFLKGVVKIVVVGAVVGSVLWRERDRLESFAALGAADLLPAILSLSLRLLVATLALYAVVAIADTVWAHISWRRRQRMSREELKQELKEQNVNPEIKAKIRQLRTQRLRKRMMAAVKTATVVVANPTHFAVALRWESGMAAPVCVAKGIDELALRIREVAAEHGVSVVENPPLARALHASVEIDDEIPVDHYKAVAEVIGFVLRLKRRAS